MAFLSMDFLRLINSDIFDYDTERDALNGFAIDC